MWLLIFVGGIVAFYVYACFQGKKSVERKAQQRGSKRPRDGATLERWRKSESRDIQRPRDPRTKFCVGNIGAEITIKYNGARRTITPIRVFTKPEFHKTYVLAIDGGEEKTFDIDDMALIVAKKRKKAGEAKTSDEAPPAPPWVNDFLDS